METGSATFAVARGTCYLQRISTEYRLRTYIIELIHTGQCKFGACIWFTCVL